MVSVVEKLEFNEAIELVGYNIYISKKSNYYYDERKNTVLVTGSEVDDYELKVVIIGDEEGLHIKPRLNSEYTIVNKNVYVYSSSDLQEEVQYVRISVKL